MAESTTWRSAEKARYDTAYLSGDYRPECGMSVWKQLTAAYDFTPVVSVLDVGCGFGDGVAYFKRMGKNAFGIDISTSLTRWWKERHLSGCCAVGSADQMPYKDSSMDFVGCFDVLEHFPAQSIKDVLDEIYRVGKVDFMFTISTIPAVEKMPDGMEPHLCIRDKRWWINALKESGFWIVAVWEKANKTVIGVAAVK